MAGIFGILESSATQWYQDFAPTQEFFFIVQSIVYGSSALNLNMMHVKSHITSENLLQRALLRNQGAATNEMQVFIQTGARLIL